MRVTQNMMNSQLLANLQANNARMSKYQDMLATGKKLNKPSDDPVGVGYAMRYEAQIARNEQYRQNVNDGRSLLEYTDSTLSNINDVLQRARELTVQTANGSMSAESREATAKEIRQLYEQLVTMGNTQLNGRYVFNGQITDKEPYNLSNAELRSTDNGTINFLMSEGVSIQVNVTGDEIFGDSATAGQLYSSDNAFAIMKTLEKALNENDGGTIGKTLEKLDSRIKKVLEVWADVGARSNRVELLDNRLADLDTNLQELLSKTADADYAETITNLKMAEAVQRASLDTGARVLQPTLIDFLK